MTAGELLVVVLGVAVLATAAMTALVAAALRGRGPLYRRVLEIGRRPEAGDSDESPVESPISGVAISQSVRLLERRRRPLGGKPEPGHGSTRSADDELDEILQGSMFAESFNRGVRIVAWSFILIVIVIIAVSQLWRPVEPLILVTLTLAGVFVLVVHEFLPPDGLGTGRIVLEASAAIVFVTMLVVLTGAALSPFFFIYPLLVGGVALISTPRATLLLTLETTTAYGIAAFSGPLEGDPARDALSRVAINLTALVLLSYAGVEVSRMQRRTRDAAIRLSTVDSLTDLHNRAYLFNAVDREIQRSRRFRRSFCLLMMDLDGLKSINDRYGHHRGDLLLRGAAYVIRSGLRGMDVAARYGGDEFVALLPETDPSGAYVVAEKIRQAASEMVVEASGQQIRTSLSIGVVSYPDDGHTADELMIAADEAMYSSKKLGKNRVVGYAAPGDLTAPFQAQPGPTPRSTNGFRPVAPPARPRRDRIPGSGGRRGGGHGSGGGGSGNGGSGYGQGPGAT